MQVDKNDPRYKEKTLKSVQTNMVHAITKDGRKEWISREQYYSGDYTCKNTNQVPVKDENGRCFLMDKNAPDIINYKHVSHDLVSAKDKTTGLIVKITQETFDLNDNYVGVNYGKVNGSDNPNAKTIKIYDAAKALVFECRGNFKSTCKREGLPFAALQNSYYQNGAPIFISKKSHSYARNHNFERCIGWSALLE